MLQIKNEATIEDLKELLPENVILLGYRGSIAHNMYITPDKPEGTDDIDVMGVCIPPNSSLYGLDRFEQKECIKDEYDSVVYELRKFVRLLEGFLARRLRHDDLGCRPTFRRWPEAKENNADPPSGTPAPRYRGLAPRSRSAHGAVRGSRAAEHQPR